MRTALWVIAIAFGLFETAYFGWNWAPKSDAEVMADGIALVLLALAFLGCA